MEKKRGVGEDDPRSEKGQQGLYVENNNFAGYEEHTRVLYMILRIHMLFQ